ncbi:MAG: biotin synthase BioB [Candidatus Tectomicrobia bacterium]|uniref:Biotin synthase n=1 Tax=Tectimicrobiota bacterium TaxID=2528274 RepID=A0A932CPV9_UNCTE|nr:biotin synthase BioB [Candidatus Tectomicrobia bacterium]
MFTDIFQIAERVIAGGEISVLDAHRLARVQRPDEVMALVAAANAVRERFIGPKVDLCSLINAKSGRCSEDCAFCAQSGHYDTGCRTYPLVSPEEMVQAAREAEAQGAERFCVVTSGQRVGPPEFQVILETLQRIREQTRLKLDCALGKLSLEEFRALRQVGVTRYNHNLEAAEPYFARICSTHTYQDRVETVKAAKEAGLEVCCGGIIGLGESPAQRLELAFALKALEVDCIPINLLNPRPGTPLASTPPLPPLEILVTISLFRLILPKRVVKLAGGREHNLRDLQAVGLLAGANGLITGGYLTTQGRSPEQDLQMIRDLGLGVRK